MDALANNCFNTFRQYITKFVSFTDAEWELVSAHLKLKQLAKKSFFSEYGKVCDEIGFIVSGSVRYYLVKDGEELTGYFSLENDLISSYKSFLTRQPALNYVQALEKTQLVVLNYHDLQKLLADELIAYKMDRFLRLVAEYYICCYEDRIVAFTTQTPEERYLQLLSTSNEVFRRIPQHYIANYLGITPVSLSRIRKRIMAPVAEKIKSLV